MNRAILIGRLTKDVELRYTQNGVAVATFTLAVDRRVASNNGQKETDFIPIVAWRQLAELCANYLKKGNQTGVDGRIQVRSYDGNDGRKNYVTEIVADQVDFLYNNNQSGQQNGQTNQNQSQTNQNQNQNQQQNGGGYGQQQNQWQNGQNNGQRNRNQSTNGQSFNPFGNDQQPININDDDLPF